MDYLGLRGCQLFLHRETVGYLVKKKTRFYDRNALINKDLKMMAHLLQNNFHIK